MVRQRYSASFDARFLEQVVQEMKWGGSGFLQQAVAELTSAPDPDPFVLSQAILEHVVPESTKPRIAGPTSAELSQCVRGLLALVALRDRVGLLGKTALLEGLTE
jgi:hypothetical protein